MELFAPAHLLIVLAICLLVFGPKKLPELSRGLGEALRGFKTAMNEPPASTDQQKTSAASSAESKDNQPKA